LKNEEVLKKVEEFEKALKELNDFFNKTQKAAEGFLGSIPQGLSLVYTWVKNRSGDKYHYWYLKGNGNSIYVGYLKLSPELIRKIRDLQSMELRVREALAVLQTYIELVEDIDWEALNKSEQRIRQRIQEKAKVLVG